MRKVDHHSSIVIVRNADKNLFFFNGYDPGYPRKEWVGCLNPFGGNADKGDTTPYSVLVRELTEELSPIASRADNFADNEMKRLQEAILKNNVPYGDFLIVDPIIEKTRGKSDEERSAIVSFYDAIIDINLLDATKTALKNGKRLTSEGDGGNIVSLDDILSGKRHLAWANPFMMKHYLGKEIPYTLFGTAEPIGQIRETFADYSRDFSVSGHWKI